MPVFKKSTKKRENESAAPVASSDEFSSQPVKTLDAKLGMDCYRLLHAQKLLEDGEQALERGGRTFYAQGPQLMGSGASKNGSSNGIGQHSVAPEEAAGKDPIKKVDSRLPFKEFRELFTLKNYWKTVRRNDGICAKTLMYKYLKTCPEAKAKYAKLSALDIESPECSEPAFESIASNYLKLFDEVISFVEQRPSDASAACQRLSSLGKMHRSKVSGIKFDDFQLLQEPFLYMISQILQDRYNDKAEMLFRKFFQFCLRFILEGFNT